MPKTSARTELPDAEEIHALFDRARAHGFDSLGVSPEALAAELLAAALAAEDRFFADQNRANFSRWGRALKSLCLLRESEKPRAFYESFVDYKAVDYETPDPRLSQSGLPSESARDQLAAESLIGLQPGAVRLRFEKHLGKEAIDALGMDELMIRWKKAKALLAWD